MGLAYAQLTPKPNQPIEKIGTLQSILPAIGPYVTGVDGVDSMDGMKGVDGPGGRHFSSCH